jgi:1-aminocyclopropane-1-carboxylate deaminase/D-cysteine desulfhydrase-like pyridoxal-dependent ACC family enzyme
MLLDTTNIPVDELNSRLLGEKELALMVARLDKIHPVVSGNKIFKLHYFLEEAIITNRHVVTFGGAYSNHLAATAYACRQSGLSCTGIVRGQESAYLSHTLQNCREEGMKLLFISREHYNVLSHNIELPNFPGIPANALIIPEGGYHSWGARGASLIMDKISNTNADFIVTAVGTATTYAGLLQKASAGQTIIAVPVLKNLADIPERLTYLNGPVTYPNTQIWSNYHFGGYAKKNSELIRFMNDFYVEYGIPSDFVYTAKMLFAVMDKIKNNQFPAGSRILCLHTGGLQGNNSLEKGTLVF